MASRILALLNRHSLPPDAPLAELRNQTFINATRHPELTYVHYELQQTPSRDCKGCGPV